jgi:hypothetical protein
MEGTGRDRVSKETAQYEDDRASQTFGEDEIDEYKLWGQKHHKLKHKLYIDF